MAVGPIQYLQPIKSFGLEQGLQLGGAIQEARARSEARDLAEQQRLQAEALKTQYANDLRATFANPTADAFAKLSLKYPQQREAVAQGYKMVSDDQKKNELKLQGQVLNALKNNNIEVATNILDERIAAIDNAGGDSSELKRIKTDMLRDPKGAMGSIMFNLSNVLDPDKFVETYGKLGEEQRKEELQPGEVSKQKAEIAKYADELGFSGPKKNKLLAETAKLEAETRKILLELEAKKGKEGVITDPKDLMKAEQALRKEYSAETGDYTKTQDAFRKINAAEDSAVGDLSLIFSFMKMLDPGSVVREGEFATAQNAAGVDQKVINMYNNIITGERLSDAQRKSFKSQAGSLLKASEEKEKSTRKTLTKVANTFGIDPNNVFGEQEEEAQKPTTKTITVDY